MSFNEIRNFVFQNSYYSTKGLKGKELFLLVNKLIQKTPDPRNAKEHYQSFLRKKTQNQQIFLDSTKRLIVWKKIATFSKRRVSIIL